MSGIISARAWGKVWAYRSTFLLGLLNTVETAIFAILLALVLGVIFGLMATSGKKILQVISRVYVEIMQNTPILLQLCFFYYALAFSGHRIGILPTGIVALGVYTGAYMAEVVRAGIESIPKGQFEAAQSQGFTYVERMYYIILPQSIKIILPPMVNQIVNLIKNTSCLYIIGGADLISLTYSFVTGENTGGAYAPAYLVSGLLFFIICYPLSKTASVWEIHLKKRDQRVTFQKTEGQVTDNEKSGSKLFHFGTKGSNALYPEGNTIHSDHCADRRRVRNCHRFRTGSVQELLHKQNYENIWYYRHRIHRSVPEYTVTAVDLHLPGVLPLPGAVQPEAVRTDHGRDEAAVQGSGCFDPVYLFRHCRDHPWRTELHRPRAV